MGKPDKDKENALWDEQQHWLCDGRDLGVATGEHWAQAYADESQLQRLIGTVELNKDARETGCDGDAVLNAECWQEFHELGSHLEALLEASDRGENPDQIPVPESLRRTCAEKFVDIIRGERAKGIDVDEFWQKWWSGCGEPPYEFVAGFAEGALKIGYERQRQNKSGEVEPGG